MSESNTPAKRTRSKSTTAESPSSRTRSKEQEHKAAAPPQKKKRASSLISISPSTKFVQVDKSDGTEEPLTQPPNASEEREEKMGSSSINVAAASQWKKLIQQCNFLRTVQKIRTTIAMR